jgi:N-acetylglutamate synthase-like GNAT family acetyltransferase
MIATTAREQIADLLNRHSRLVRRLAAADIEKGHYITIEVDDTVLASVCIKKLNWYLTEIKHLVVHPNYRNQGFGRAAVERCTEAKAKGARIAQCTIRNDNTASESLFGSEGFQCVGHFEGLGRTDVGLWQKVL